ncbi:uncharacterized protein VTP21DRAFT_3152 [Calcarisporiella thermophila]|uniref:uncharacterized protein n=1 Tax=Calcarisporiella thermophila TaxID=911321 RepID=UPI003742B15A
MIMSIYVFAFLITAAVAFTPAPKSSFGQLLLGNRLMFYGGATIKNGIPLPSSELAILDLSQQWDVSKPAWLPVSGEASLPFPVAGNVLLPGGNAKDPYMVTFGGMVASSFSPNDPNTEFKLALSNYTWSAGTAPSRRAYSSAVSEKNGVSWVYGGQMELGEDIHVLNELYRFDGATFKWEQIITEQMNPVSGPVTGHTGKCCLELGKGHRNDLTVFLLSRDSFFGERVRFIWAREIRGAYSLLFSRKMIVLGGHTGTEMRSMGVAYIFDTAKRVWSTKDLVGPYPPKRWLHGATITQDGGIFICGGTDGVSSLFGDAWILNTRTWSWIQLNPGISPGAIPPTPRMRHQCARSGSNVMIMFGATEFNGTTMDNNIFVYDVTTGNFTNRYVPSMLETNFNLDPPMENHTPPANPPIVPNTMPQVVSQPALSQGAIIGTVLGSILIVGAVAIVAVLLILRHRRKYNYRSNPGAGPLEGTSSPEDDSATSIGFKNGPPGYSPGHPGQHPRAGHYSFPIAANEQHYVGGGAYQPAPMRSMTGDVNYSHLQSAPFLISIPSQFPSSSAPIAEPHQPRQSYPPQSQPPGTAATNNVVHASQSMPQGQPVSNSNNGSAIIGRN